MIELVLTIIFGMTTIALLAFSMTSIPKVVSKYGLKLRFITDALTRKKNRDMVYTGFKFSRDRFSTEHSGKVLYYVQPEHLFHTKNYRDLDTLCDLMATRIRDAKLDFDCVVGIPLAGSHLGILVAQKLKKPFAAFGYEIESKGEIRHPYEITVGYTPRRGQKVLLIDDTSVSGFSVIDATIKLRKVGVVVHDAFVFLDKEEGAKENLAKLGVNLYYLTIASDLLDVLKMENKITDEAYNMIMDDMLIRREDNKKRIAEVFSSDKTTVF